ncbi:universal stress protein [Thermodesulfobacterium sp. TA1]|uniref:universal stress protein n=1 Tax=Thermodesulfobacterium sp. TA1 TaxID=2234087 RepID=UPI001231C52E|nr:universal stress protein [Thermodesulfobacterium sp. TA1]QER42680.1 universal stress protein [Thermodesulfobacterium sp. TA1]
MEKILIATDGSQASEKAAKLGLKFAKTFNSKVYGLSIAEVIPVGPELMEIYPKLVEVLERKAFEAVGFIKAEAEKEGISCETFVLTSSDPSEIILSKLEELGISLLMMGRKHTLGRVSRTIIGKASVPVTVVPAEACLTLEKVLLATDGSVYSQRAAFWTVDFCKKLDIALYVVSVAKIDNEVSFAEECVKTVEEKAKNQGVKVETLVVKGEPFEKILEVSSQKEVNLIIMGCKGKTGLEKILIGSVAERVVENSNVPVVLVK